MNYVFTEMRIELLYYSTRHIQYTFILKFYFITNLPNKLLEPDSGMYWVLNIVLMLLFI